MLQKNTKTGTTVQWWRPFGNNASNPKGLKFLITTMLSCFISLGCIICLSGCKKEDKNDGGNASTIKTTNVIYGSSKIATVKARIIDGPYGAGYTIAEALYQNNGFTLELPEAIPAKYLKPMFDDDMTGITVSDITVKSASLMDITAYDWDGDNIGYLEYLSADPYDDDDNIIACWIYVNKDVTVNGQSYNKEWGVINKYDNLTLKKGWNIYYETYAENRTTEREIYTFLHSNKKPSGVILNWYFSGDIYDYN